MTDNKKEAADDFNKIIDAAIESNDIEKIYFNGFSTSLGSGDVVIVLQRFGKPIKVLNASYTMVKTLSIKLGEIITTLERTTGNSIMTTDEINAKLQTLQKSK